jgi:hypothetical protein
MTISSGVVNKAKQTGYLFSGQALTEVSRKLRVGATHIDQVLPTTPTLALLMVGNLSQNQFSQLSQPFGSALALI